MNESGQREEGPEEHQCPIRRIRRRDELDAPASTLQELEQVSPELLGGLGLSFAIFVISGVLADEVNLISLLAVPPLLTALVAYRVETAIVAGVCLLLGLVGASLYGDFGGADYFAAALVIASGGAIALAVADLRERMELANQAAELLSEAGAKLIDDTADVERATRHIAELAIPALADQVAVELVDGNGRIRPATALASDPRLTKEINELRQKVEIDPEGKSPVATAIRTGHTVVLPTVSGAMIEAVARTQGIDRDKLQSVAPRSVLVVPLRSGGRVLGAVALGTYDRRPRYREWGPRVAVAEALASRAAMALDSARQHERQAEIADVLQRDLMPPALPDVPGVSIASGFQAAGDLSKVGGDFYDVIPVARNEWIVVIGDVCGKGPEAAALTGLVRHMLRVLVEFESRPSGLLARLSDHLRRERTDVQFCTAVVVRMTQTGQGIQLLASNAGHPAPLVVNAQGITRELAAPDELLGVFPEAVERRNEGWLLEPGETLVLYTDGLVEGSAELERDWIEERLRAMNGEEPGRLTSELMEFAIARQPPKRTDDIAVLAFRVD